MKNIKFIYTKTALFLTLIFIVTVSCERDLSEDVAFATNSKTGEIFTDSPIGLGTDFYFPFLGSKPTALTFDGVGYESATSMRFDVPNANDPEGGFAGGILRVDGAGRNLTGFDALTFWAKASRGVTIDGIGFGVDFLENKYEAGVDNLLLSTDWVKYIIPIPDPSKLIEERGMFKYSAGTELTGGFGYTFWIDDLKFEKLGTLGAPRPQIANGFDLEADVFLGTQGEVGGPEVKFNLPSGLDQTVRAAGSYFDWTSSEPSVVSVGGAGELSTLSTGTATITASMAGVQAEGSLNINVLGEFETAPIPPARAPVDVISIFSDAYNNVPVDYYNGYFLDGFQTTQGQNDIFIGNDNIISYTELNFVAIGTFLDVAPVNATFMTHIHMDINVQEAVDSGDYIDIQLLNSVGNDETSGTVRINSSELLSEEWVSIDIPLDDFGLVSRNELGLIFFISDATISSIFVDNVYYYRE